jgi:flagellar capping protein FliD
MLSSAGTISKESANATSRISKYKDDLAALEERMTRLLERYTKQFAAMDSIVGAAKNTQTGLTSTFTAMMNQYK